MALEKAGESGLGGKSIGFPSPTSPPVRRFLDMPGNPARRQPPGTCLSAARQSAPGRPVGLGSLVPSPVEALAQDSPWFQVKMLEVSRSMSESNGSENQSGAGGPANSIPVSKSKSKTLVAVLAVVLVLAGGGAGGWFYLRNVKGAEKKAKPSHIQVEPEEEEAETKPEAEKKTAGANSSGLYLPADRDVKKVVDIGPFILNLADLNESCFLRITISVGVGESGTEEKADPLFTARVRNAFLSVLLNKTSKELLTPEGKVALRKELLRVVRKAAPEPEIQAVYITEFVVQR